MTRPTKRPPGRPRKVRPTPTKVLLVLSPDALAAADRLRGSIDRSTWVTMVLEALGMPDPEQAIRVVLALTRHHAKIGREPA